MQSAARSIGEFEWVDLQVLLYSHEVAARAPAGVAAPRYGRDHLYGPGWDWRSPPMPPSSGSPRRAAVAGTVFLAASSKI